MGKSFVGSKEDRKIVIKEHTLWTKIEVAVLAYFVKHQNKPATYREIARAYVSASYSNYQKACESLLKRGYLVKESGIFRIHPAILPQIKKGKESVERDIPYFQVFLKRLKH